MASGLCRQCLVQKCLDAWITALHKHRLKLNNYLNDVIGLRSIFGRKHIRILQHGEDGHRGSDWSRWTVRTTRHLGPERSAGPQDQSTEKNIHWQVAGQHHM